MYQVLGINRFMTKCILFESFLVVDVGLFFDILYYDDKRRMKRCKNNLLMDNLWWKNTLDIFRYYIKLTVIFITVFLYQHKNWIIYIVKNIYCFECTAIFCVILESSSSFLVLLKKNHIYTFHLIFRKHTHTEILTGNCYCFI